MRNDRMRRIYSYRPPFVGIEVTRPRRKAHRKIMLRLTIPNNPNAKGKEKHANSSGAEPKNRTEQNRTVQSRPVRQEFHYFESKMADR